MILYTACIISRSFGSARARGGRGRMCVLIITTTTTIIIIIITIIIIIIIIIISRAKFVYNIKLWQYIPNECPCGRAMQRSAGSCTARHRIVTHIYIYIYIHTHTYISTISILLHLCYSYYITLYVRQGDELDRLLVQTASHSR